MSTFPKTLLAVVCCTASLLALDSRRPLADITHDRWGPEQGFSWGAVHAIAQTADGYLWIGTEQGLVRFDGASFRLLDSKRAPALPPGRVLGLLADHENNLWIRFATEGLFRYRNGEISDMIAGQEDRLIEMMYLRADGKPIFQSTFTTVFSYEPGTKMIRLGLTIRPVVTAPAETADGTLWLGTRDDGLLFLKSPQEGVQKTSFRSGRVNCLAPDGGGGLWIGMDDGVRHWDGANASKRDVPIALRQVKALSMIRDREGNLWIGTSKGLLRLTDGVVSALDIERRPRSVYALFEGREGNIWFGNSQGLERLREKPFVTYSRISQTENVAENDGPLWADSTGRLWFAPVTGGLYWRRGATVQHIEDKSLDHDVVYSITGGPNDVWVGRQNGGLTRLGINDTGLGQTYTTRNGLAAGSVYCVHRSRDGTVWAGTIGGGVSQLKGGRFQTFTAANGLASNSVTAIEEDNDGTVWFATTGGLSAFSNGRWRTYTQADGLPPRNIISLAADGPFLWIGTSGGLAVLRDGRIAILDDAPVLLHEPINGIALAPAHDRDPASVWIAVGQCILRINRDRLISGKIDAGDIRVFEAADGLRGTENLKRFRSVITDDVGRIWFSTNRGVAVVDPEAVAKRSVPIIVHIQTVTADERTLGDEDELDQGTIIRIQAAPHRVVFRYIGLGLTDPARVLFRYRLDGYDTAWSNPTALREAAYTNLGPGSYRFHVTARNAAGAWSPTEVTTTVSIAPLFWQTWWFAGLCILGLAATAISVYRLRTRQLTRGLQIRFDERLRERTLIARELHDTLLQGFLGACMKLEVALDRLPDGSLARPAFEGVLALMRRVIDEARNTVRGLRLSEDQSEFLEDVFYQIQEEVVGPQETELRVLVEGRRRPLNAALREEVYRIGKEAVVNALRHSGAKLIEVELEYATEEFSLRVRDNGRGIDSAVLRDGREGHWGLQGMRERAERAGARLTLWSGASAGTEVVLVVPKNIAYSTPQEPRSTSSHKKL